MNKNRSLLKLSPIYRYGDSSTVPSLMILPQSVYALIL
jgi:hypothetical protein